MAIDLRGRSSVSFYDTFSAFPATGSTTILYVDRGDMVVYIWNGSSYDQLNNGSNITTVANYSALLAIGASNVPNMFYWCSSAQGTSWLPGPLGGTYYNSGLYYSNGTSWEYMNSPYQATQLEVDAGIVGDKFVTPSTFYNSSKWDSIPTGITIGTTPITSGVAGRVLFEGAGNVVQEDASFLFDGTNKTLTNYGKGVVTSNTSFGIGVFQNGTGAGTQNTAIGWGAANYLTSGSNNTMVGYRAGGSVLASNFTGNNNTLIGTGSGLYLSSGAQNTFVGNSTGTSITTGSFNTIIGHYTGSLAAGLAQNVIISDGNNQVALWMNGSQRVGFGYNPLSDTLGAKLDVRAQGALSTDIAFRVRNSADTANLLALNGLGNLFLSPPTLYGETAIYGDATDPILRYTHSAFGSVALGHGAKVATAFPNSTDAYNIAIGLNASTAGTSGAMAMGYTARCIGTYGIKIGHHQGASSFGGTNSIHLGRTTSGNDILADNVFMTYFNSQSSSTLTRSNGSFGLLGQQAYILVNGTGTYGLDKFMGDGGNTFVVRNHASIPSTNVADSFQQYSADITAGNAAPHFRTENGSVVKLYQNAAVTTPQGIADALTNLGVLASSTIASSIPTHDGTTYDTNAIQTLTAAEYAAIGTPNASTIYFIV